MKQSKQIAADETGWRIGGWPAWLHVWVGGRSTAYAIDSQRGTEVLERIIGSDCSGILTHDGFASYGRFAAATHQQCLAHVLRRARDLLATATRGAVHFPQRVISLFTEAIHLRNEHLRHPRSVPRKHLRERRDDFELRLLKLVSPTRIVPEPLDTS